MKNIRSFNTESFINLTKEELIKWKELKYDKKILHKLSMEEYGKTKRMFHNLLDELRNKGKSCGACGIQYGNSRYF